MSKLVTALLVDADGVLMYREDFDSLESALMVSDEADELNLHAVLVVGDDTLS